jgi:hypothetical protein
VKFVKGQGASAAACREIGRESGDAFEEVLGSSIEIEDHRFLWLSAARFGKGAPGSWLFRCGLVRHKTCSSLERLFLGVAEAFAAFFAPWR